MQLQGHKSFSCRRDELWRRLTDLGFLVGCLPDVARVEEVTPTSARAVLRPGFSFVRGELHLTLERQPDPAPGTAAYLVQTKGVGSSTAVLATFRLAEPAGEDPSPGGPGEGCLLQWSAEIRELGGVLKAVPRSLVQAGAMKVVSDLLAGIERQLASPSATPLPPPGGPQGGAPQPPAGGP